MPINLEINYLDSNINSVYEPQIDSSTGNVKSDYLINENKYLRNENDHEGLLGILNVRKKMLEVNLERNDVKNKIIYTLFSLIMIIIIITISVHTNFKK
jgi:hypothetical protein